MALNAGVNGIYLPRSDLDVAFYNNSRQVNPLITRLTGNVAGVMTLLNRCGRPSEFARETALLHHYPLMTRQGASGEDD